MRLEVLVSLAAGLILGLTPLVPAAQAAAPDVGAKAAPVLPGRGGDDSVMGASGAHPAESGRANDQRRGSSVGGSNTVWPPARDLSGFTRARFLIDRQRLGTALVEALEAVRAGRAPQPALTQARFDLAEFYMAHVLLAEARSVLRMVDRTGMDPAAQARLSALQTGLHLLAKERPTLRAPLQKDWQDWPDQPLWLAVAASLGSELSLLDPAEEDQHIDAKGSPHPAKGAEPQVKAPVPGADPQPDLAAAVARLTAFPAPFVEAVLPGLLEVAIRTQDWRMARELARRFDDHAALRDGETYHYLLGRAAQAGGALLVAFDNYARASGGTGRDAHRARLALVDMGLSSRTLRPDEARALVGQARSMWRGDDLAVQTLRTLARLDLSLGDRVAALNVFGEILINYTDHPDTPLVRQKANVLLAEFYNSGADGTIALSAFLEGHRQLAIHYRFEDGFARYAEQFADTLLAAGATSIASREYDAVHDYLSVSRDLGLREVPPERIDALRLKQIGALFAGGRQDEAAQLLAQTRPGASAEMQEKLALIEARIHAATDNREALFATNVTAPTDGYLRLMADARFANGDWEAAREIYRRLWREQGNGFPFRDAISLLLAAHRSGDEALTRELAQAFPSLTDVPQWGEIAMGLTEAPQGVDPLRRDQARSRMDRAGRTLENLATIKDSILR